MTGVVKALAYYCSSLARNGEKDVVAYCQSPQQPAGQEKVLFGVSFVLH